MVGRAQRAIHAAGVKDMQRAERYFYVVIEAQRHERRRLLDLRAGRRRAAFKARMRARRERNERKPDAEDEERKPGRSTDDQAAFPGWTVPQFPHVRCSTLA